MTKYEWDRKLKRLLKDLPKEERDRIFEYYDELYEDKADEGMKESEIVERFGDPEAAAEKILADYDTFLTRCAAEEKTAKTTADVGTENAQAKQGETDAAAETAFASRTDAAGQPYAGETRAERGFNYDRDGGAAPVQEDVFALSQDSGTQSATPQNGKQSYVAPTEPSRSYDYYGADFDVYTENTDKQYAYVKKLKLDMSETDVVIRKADKFSIRLKEDKSTRYTIETARDTLYVKEKYARRFQFFNFASRAKTMIIELPVLDEVAFNSVKRGCEVQDHRMRHVSLKTVNGDIKLLNCSGEYLSLSATNGGIEINGGEYGGFTVTTTSADIAVENIAVRDAAIISTSGDLVCKNVMSTGTKLLMKTISGDVSAKELTLNDGEFKTISGDVDVYVKAHPDDYNVKVSTITGDVKAPRGGNGGKQLTVSTISGDVQIAFV